MNDIIQNVTLLKLMNTVGNINNTVSIVGHKIFDSNYENTSIDNIIIEYNIISFVRVSNIYHIKNSVVCSKICQKKGKIKIDE